MKGTNKGVTICGAIGFGCMGVATVPMPDPWGVYVKIFFAVVGAFSGGVAAYLSKGKDVTGGTVQQ